MAQSVGATYSSFQRAVQPCANAPTASTYRAHVPCTVPMYHVPCTCNKNVVPILAADVCEIAAEFAELAAKSAAISQRSPARIGTTFLVHGYGIWYMGTVHGPWVR